MSVEIIYTNNPVKLLAQLQNLRAQELQCAPLLAWRQTSYLAHNSQEQDLLKESLANTDPQRALGLHITTLKHCIDEYALRAFPNMHIVQGTEELSLIAKVLRLQAHNNSLARGFVNRDICCIFQEILGDIEILPACDYAKLEDLAQNFSQNDESYFVHELLLLHKAYQEALEAYSCKSSSQVAASFFASVADATVGKDAQKPLYIIDLPAKLNQRLLSFIVACKSVAHCILIARQESATSLNVYEAWERVVFLQVGDIAVQTCFYEDNKKADKTYSQEEECCEDREILCKRFCNNEAPSLQTPLTEICDFIFPAGMYAQDKLLVEALKAQDLHTLRNVAIASSNPLAVFTQISPQFPHWKFELHLSLSFEETELGRLLITLMSIFLNDEDFTRESLYALMANPLVGLDSAELSSLDTWVRQDRLLDHEDFLELACNNLLLKSLFETLEQEDLDGLYALLKSRLSQLDEGSYEQSSNMRALELVRKACSYCTVERDTQGFADVCRQIIFAVQEESWHERCIYSARTENDDLGCICIAPVPKLLQYPEQSFDLLVLLELNATNIPLKDSLPAHADILGHLGRFAAQSELSLARNCYAFLLKRMRSKLVLGRVLADTFSNEEVPSIIFDDLLEALGYDECPSKQSKSAQSWRVITGGEEDSSWKYLHLQEGEVKYTVNQYRGASKLPDLVKCRKGRPCASPSQIEEYCSCPYRWFYRSRLRAQSIDEVCGPNSVGSFAHELLQRFYQDVLPSQGVMRIPSSQEHFEKRELWEVNDGAVSFEGVSSCQEALLESFDRLTEEILASSLSRPAKRSARDPERLAPLLPEEFEFIKSTSESLRDFVMTEGSFASQFIPRYFEWEFGKDGNFEFAGFCVQGKVDRIDIRTLPDGSMQAIVIDYKSSGKKHMDALEFVSLDHFLRKRASLKEDALGTNDCSLEEYPCSRHIPYKIQTLIYAQAVRKILGIEVVAALYLGIRDQSVHGASLPGIIKNPNSTKQAPYDVSSLGYDSFNHYLDNREADISCVLQDLLCGNITPSPNNEDACSYCERLVCPVRDGEALC